MRSPYYSAGWKAMSPATEMLINYFWLHWTYLALIWGTLLFLAGAAALAPASRSSIRQSRSSKYVTA